MKVKTVIPMRVAMDINVAISPLWFLYIIDVATSITHHSINVGGVSSHL